jgi:hypothetical protein
MKRYHYKIIVPIILVALSLFTGLTVASSHPAKAVSASDWNASSIIDDFLFYDNTSMSASDIQTFMNSKNSSCDTQGTRPASEYGRSDLTHAQYAASVGWPGPPYVCLRDYYQVPRSDQNINNLSTNVIPSGAISAAQIIKNAADTYSISPKVLLVLIQKESVGPLLTDTWPLPSQYRSVVGYACPDTAPCDPSYAGFYNQIMNAAYQFKYYKDHAYDKDQYGNYIYRHQPYNTATLLYNPNASCGSTQTTMSNYSTTALYNYTPYQPNQAALNNLYGVGDGCSAYGNRNFWRMFNDWFGSTKVSTPYAWSLVSQEAYTDSARTIPFTDDVAFAPGQTIYVRVKAKNIGSKTWSNTTTKIGTSNPIDRSSVFQDASWLSAVRPAAVTEASVMPGDIGTFDFALKAPSTTGTYKEYFNILIEGQAWLQDIGLYYTLNVTQPISPRLPEARLNSGEELKTLSHLTSSDGQNTLQVQGDGNIVVYSRFKPRWWSGIGGSIARLIMQADGNLVAYSSDMTPRWASGTDGHPGAYLRLQSDGNLVVYSSTGTALWNAGTTNTPNFLDVTTSILPRGDMYVGQSLETVDRNYRFVLQGDGNVVLYKQGIPLWATGTDGKPATRLSMQSDGNLVLYDTSQNPLWYSRTAGRGNSRLLMQTDGNLVIYNTSGATWATYTNK